MTTTPAPEPDDRPLDLEGVPAEEGISEADAAERLDQDPETQQNREDVR